MPKDWAALTVDKQSADPDSTLSFFRRALELRKRRVEFDGDGVDWLDASGDAVIFRRPGGLVCALNCGAQPVPLPPGNSSWPARRCWTGNSPDSAAWLA